MACAIALDGACLTTIPQRNGVHCHVAVVYGPQQLASDLFVVPFNCLAAMQGVQLPQCPAAAQLAVLDQLLWHAAKSSASAGGRGGRNNSSDSTPDGASGSSSSFKGWAKQLLVRFALGRLDVQLQDCRCQFVVPRVLGPQSQLPAHQVQQQYDGVALSMRLLTVSPQSDAAGAGAATTGAAAAAASLSTSNMQGASLHEAVGEVLLGRDPMLPRHHMQLYSAQLHSAECNQPVCVGLLLRVQTGAVGSGLLCFVNAGSSCEPASLCVVHCVVPICVSQMRRQQSATRPRGDSNHSGSRPYHS